MGLFRTFDTSASALTMQRTRIDVISNNLANANSTRRSDGVAGPYRRQRVVVQPRGQEFYNYMVPFLNRPLLPVDPGEGVRISGIQEDNSAANPLRRVYDPGHPDADKDGYVMYPNVNTVTEMVDLIDASRAYQANTAAITATRDMINSSLRIAG